MATAHDVRHLRVCAGCRRLGDGRLMLHFQAPGADSVDSWHGVCGIEVLGEEATLSLPIEMRRRLTIEDTGVKLMKRLLASVDAEEPLAAVER